MKSLSIVLFIFLPICSSYSQNGFIKGSPQIAYWEYGKSKTVIIIINGGPGYDHSYLRPEWDRLSSISKIIYYDQRGCGKSENSSNYSWIEHLKDLKRLKDQLFPQKKVILASSSWGTNIALIYALYFPDDIKGLILSGFTDWKGINVNKVDLFSYQIDSINNYKRITPFSQDYISIIKSHYRPATDYFSHYKLNEMSDSSFQKRLYMNSNEMTKQTIKSLRSMPDLTFLSKINIPTLIIKGNIDCGIEDWSDVLANIINNSEYYIIKNSCHDPWYSNSEEFFPKCIKFIKQIKHNLFSSPR